VGRLTAGCCGSGSGGGAPSGYSPQQQITWEGEVSGGDSASEFLLGWAINFDIFGVGKTLYVDFTAWVKGENASESAIAGIYVGGTRAAVDGTLRAQVTSLTTGFVALNQRGAGFVNPGGLVPVKLVVNGALGSNAGLVYVQGLSIVILQ
jgi:hypothetical protein